MIGRGVFCLTILCGLLLGPQSYAEDKPTLRWLVWDQVPNYILQGPFQGQGAAGLLTKALQDQLPQYHHVNVVSNAQRYRHLIREENVCVAWAWIVPGSREYRLHSRPISLAPRTGIQVLKAKQSLFGPPGASLSLANLLRQPKLRLGYLNGMSYSKQVHELLELYRGSRHVYSAFGSSVEFKLPMLDRGRVDYFFGFSAQSIYDAEMRGVENNYQFYNLDEMDLYTSMYSHCSNTAFGKTAMRAINRLLTDELLLEHLSRVERWYGDNEDYREVFMHHVIEQIPHPLVTDPGQ